MAPRGFSVEMLIEKYTGKRFGSWIVGKDFYREERQWHVDVLCDCGKTWKVTTASLTSHRGCSCLYLEKVAEKMPALADYMESLGAEIELSGLTDVMTRTLEEVAAIAKETRVGGTSRSSKEPDMESLPPIAPTP